MVPSQAHSPRIRLPSRPTSVPGSRGGGVLAYRFPKFCWGGTPSSLQPVSAPNYARRLVCAHFPPPRFRLPWPPSPGLRAPAPARRAGEWPCRAAARPAATGRQPLSSWRGSWRAAAASGRRQQPRAWQQWALPSPSPCPPGATARGAARLASVQYRAQLACKTWRAGQHSGQLCCWQPQSAPAPWPPKRQTKRRCSRLIPLTAGPFRRQTERRCGRPTHISRGARFRSALQITSQSWGVLTETRASTAGE